jgi:hypothetical protein
MTKEQRDERIEKMMEIIAGIDHWLFLFPNRIESRVGAVIQRYATRELDFMAYINNVPVPMDDLRMKANDVLGEMGEMRIPVPIKAAQCNWVTMPYPNFTVTTEPTRREELEAMSNGEIETIFYERESKELKQERIDYILESEKDYGTE